MGIQIKRVYDDAAKDDGYRVLVDRLWPRGVTKEHAHVDLWLKEVAPSIELRHWWNHDPDRAEEFETRYRSELKDDPETAEALAHLRKIVKENMNTTLVYSAKDPHLNQARVLARYLGASDVH